MKLTSKSYQRPKIYVNSTGLHFMAFLIIYNKQRFHSMFVEHNWPVYTVAEKTMGAVILFKESNLVQNERSEVTWAWKTTLQLGKKQWQNSFDV